MRDDASQPMAALRHVVATPIRDNVTALTGYIRHGKGEPLVLVHGVGLNAEVWHPQVDALRHRFDVIALDILGHGRSTLPPEDATLEDFSHQVLALLDVLRLDAVHLAGHSMGASIVMDFAMRHGHRVRSLIGLSPVFNRTPDQRLAVSRRATALHENRTLPTIDTTIARWFGNPVAVGLQDRALEARSMLESVRPAGYARAYRVFATADRIDAQRLNQLRTRAIFITGELDPNSTPEMSAALALAVRDAHYAVIEGAKHMVPLTTADEINSRMAAFLETVPDDPSVADNSGSIPQ